MPDMTPLEQAIMDRIQHDFLDPDTLRFDAREYVTLTYITYTDPSGKGRRASDRSVAKALSSLGGAGLVDITPDGFDEDGRGKFQTYRVRPALPDSVRTFAGQGYAAVERMKILDRYSSQPDYEAIEDGLRRTIRMVFEKIPMCEKQIGAALESGSLSLASRYTKTLSEMLASVEDIYPLYEIWDAEMYRGITQQVSAIAPGESIPTEISGKDSTSDHGWTEIISSRVSY